MQNPMGPRRCLAARDARREPQSNSRTIRKARNKAGDRASRRRSEARPGSAIDGPPALRRFLGAAAAAGPPHSTAPKGLHEKCPAAALRSSSNRASVRPSSRALHLSTFRANAAPSGFCISLLGRTDGERTALSFGAQQNGQVRQIRRFGKMRVKARLQRFALIFGQSVAGQRNKSQAVIAP